MIDRGTNILSEHSRKKLKFDGNLKQINFLDQRVYQRDENTFYPSVTSVLQYMPKAKFFEQWLKEVGFNADIIMRRAGEEGTQLHEAVERLLRGEQIEWMDDFGKAKYSQTVWEMILKFIEFWNLAKPKLIESEKFVYSDVYKYAGTTDLIVELDGEIWLIDIKTSNTYHRSFELQVAAYARAYTEITGVEIQRTGVLWMKSTKRGPSKKKNEYQGKGWELKAVDEVDKNHELFMLIYKLYELEHEEVEPVFRSYPTVVSLTTIHEGE
jgi:hypothetical protein